MKIMKIRAKIKKCDDYSSNVTIHGLLDHLALTVHNSIINEDQQSIKVEVIASDERRLCIQIAPEHIYTRLHGPDNLWISKSLEV